jgi:hypothetical protein
MTYDIKAYKTKETYDNYGEYLLEIGFLNKKDAIKSAKELLPEYSEVYVHSADDEEIIKL